MKNVLITGADRFIGSNLTELLVSQGYQVKALSQYNRFNSWGWLEDVDCLADIEVLNGDVRDQVNQEALSCTHPGNCVNSFSSYGFEALVFEGNGEQAMALLRATLATFPEATIVNTAPLYLEVIFTTPIGFKDQIEFRIDEPSKRIDYRSRSKIGLYDFNKNRSRMQDFSASFRATAVNSKKAIHY